MYNGRAFGLIISPTIEKSKLSFSLFGALPDTSKTPFIEKRGSKNVLIIPLEVLNYYYIFSK